MDGLNSYERLVTAALLASLGLCTALAGVKFFRNRAKTLSILLRAQGALFALFDIVKKHPVAGGFLYVAAGGFFAAVALFFMRAG